VHVLLTHPSAELYGSDRMALESVVALVSRGIRVTTVLPVDGPLRAELESAGSNVVVRAIPVLRKAALRPAGLLRLIRDLVAKTPQMVAVVRQARPDVVYVNTIVQPWWMLIGRLFGSRVVVHVREAEVEPPRLVRRALLLPLVAAHSIVANSRFTERQVIADGPRVGERTSVIYNGKDWSAYEVEHEESAAGEFRVLYLGRLSPRKGTDILVRAVSLLRTGGRDIQLTLAGAVFPGYEWYEEELRQLCSDSGLGDSVRFAGFVDDPRPLLARADVMVVPSRAEPFGTVAAEGMASGLPVVVSDVQGLVEIVSSDQVGLVVPAEDPEAIARAVARLQDDPALRYRLSVHGSTSVRDRFSRERYRAEIADEIVRIANG
jgi:glycosyltransferase involved in cell wall biosynthesis